MKMKNLKAMKKHIRKNVYNENEIEPYEGKARPLNLKINKEEFSRTAKKLSNKKAVQEDGIPNEMIKYGLDELQQEIANKLNELCGTHTNELNTGESILLPIPKPNKPAGS